MLQYHHKQESREDAHPSGIFGFILSKRGKSSRILFPVHPQLWKIQVTHPVSLNVSMTKKCNFPCLTKTRNISSAKLHFWLSGICGLALRPLLEVCKLCKSKEQRRQVVPVKFIKCGPSIKELFKLSWNWPGFILPGIFTPNLCTDLSLCMNLRIYIFM